MYRNCVGHNPTRIVVELRYLYCPPVRLSCSPGHPPVPLRPGQGPQEAGRASQGHREGRQKRTSPPPPPPPLAFVREVDGDDEVLLLPPSGKMPTK